MPSLSPLVAGALAAAVPLAGSPSAPGEEPIENAGFEAASAEWEPGAEPLVPGWSAEIGAMTGGRQPGSLVVFDRDEKHGGKASLHFHGDASTRGWWILKQEVPVRTGGEYRLTAWTRADGVRPAGSGFDNCYVGLFFFDAEGKVVDKQYRFPELPDSKWTKQDLELTAPETTRRAEVYLFLSMLGDFRVDDLELKIRGGEALPEPERVLFEDFARAKRLTSKWKLEVGATNGTGGTESVVAIDPDVGAPGSPHSLRFAGDAATTTWYLAGRTERANPGERYVLRAEVKAEDVRREGNQFANLHANLAFLDLRGEVIGGLHFGNVEPGTHDWTDVEVVGVSPDETAKVRAGFFLSMSGTAWLDDVELTRQAGFDPPYHDWEKIETKEIVLRFPPDHPNAAQMKQYALRLDQAKDDIRRALEVEFDEPITVYVYASSEQGRALTGADLDFADPESRTVHQRFNSYIAHEMVHVIAHTKLGQGQTGLLGEGIAVWLNGQAPEAHHRLAQQLLAKGELPPMSGLLEAFRSQENGYPAAGSFCGWLLQEYGLEAFEELYPLGDPSARAKELLGKGFPEMEADWHAELAKYR